MKVAGEYTFDAPIDLVWHALQDPNILASILPGCDKLEQKGENEYVGGLNIKVGPVQGKFNGHIKLENVRPLEGYTMVVDGSGPAGFVKATGGLTLAAQGDKTHIDYEGDAQVGGRIASVGQRLIESSAKAIIRQSLDALNTVLKLQAEAVAASAPVTAAATAPPPEPVNNAVEKVSDMVADSANAVQSVAQAATAPRPAPPVPPSPKVQGPSQIEFATGVAKEVAKDLIPAQYRPLLIGVVVILVLLLLYRLFS
jgi:carbon monoxide dehydrogenase subunit G